MNHGTQEAGKPRRFYGSHYFPLPLARDRSFIVIWSLAVCLRQEGHCVKHAIKGRQAVNLRH